MMSRTFRLIFLLLTALSTLPASADLTQISQKPLIVANPDAVKANLLFILDDSGSMNFDFLPDHINTALCRSSGATPANSGNFANTCCIGGNSSNACWSGAAPFGTLRGQPPFLAAGFNGMAYDPAVTYLPPVKADGTEWPSQTRAATAGWTAVKNDAYNVQNTGSINLVTGYPDTEWCVDNTFNDCLRNDNYVLPGSVVFPSPVGSKSYTVYHATVASGEGSVATGAPDNASAAARKFGPHYYSIIPAEYCKKADLRECSSTAGGDYTVPAPLRWCKTDADARATTPSAAACQATRNNTFAFARFPTKFFSAGQAGSAEVRATAGFTIGNLGCTLSVTAINVGSTNLLANATANSNNQNTVGNAIVAAINNKTAVTGYTAVATNSGRTVTISAPAGLNTTATLTITRTPTSCNLPLSSSSLTFSGYAPAVAAIPGSYAGSFRRVDIHPDYGPFSRPASRADCALIKTAGTCTYDEEMTNFANWWTYYHSRMQSMKSSASLAFGKVGNNRRVGYMSINNSTGTDFLNLDTFETTQRAAWFGKLTASRPNSSTPLRTALSKAGRLYAGKYNNVALNGVTARDPIQYSCQRNAAILSTDGFWNETTIPTKPDGTEIGDPDSAATLTAPIKDGNATANTLADVAYYYNYNDLRTGTTGQGLCVSGSGTNADVCGNEVPENSVQKMLTFTLGLGVSGYMQFIDGYLKGLAPDYEAVKNGETANPGSGVCSWQGSGQCTWPVPASNTLTTVDDLWHAAVNGGGSYFSATNPTSLEKGLTSALSQFDGTLGAAAAATTSNPNVSASDNRAFVSDFKSSDWTGELRSQFIDLNDGTLLPDGGWSARGQLDARAPATRKILMFGSGPTKLQDFTWSAITNAGQSRYFEKAWITAASGSGNTSAPLSQFCSGPAYCLDSSDQDKAAGETLVNFLRGVRTHEGDLDTATTYFRSRKFILGDIVNSEAVYVNKALVKYADDSYATFQATTRTPMVYVGANDGMLHAFDADTGAEVWAYVPTAVIPNLYKLADKQYATRHQYFVDATPFVQDIKIGGEWRTILVGGLGAGGRAYYALDITNPAEPKALWEFSHDNLGYTFGTPEIGKLRDGTWVVVLPSGYNNVSPGDGKGRLFVLNAATGVPVTTLPNGISTGAGDTATPAGLAHIRAWVDNASLDNTIQRVYAGDNLGNVWRFDVNDSVGTAGYEALQLAKLKNASGQIQSVTSRPELGQVADYAMVYVGTGRYLGENDLTDTTAQSIYAIKDALTANGHGEVRAPGSTFVRQELTNTTCLSTMSWCRTGAAVRTTSTVNAVNLAENSGWYVDLPISRERVNTDPLLVLGTLVVISNVVESGNVCKVGGSSWVNFFDYKTGKATSVSLGDVIASRPTVYRLPNQKLVGLARGSDGSNRYFEPPTGSPVSTTRRVSWRDLLQQ
jgi:type IV pilus assembly protein PilY1